MNPQLSKPELDRLVELLKKAKAEHLTGIDLGGIYTAVTGRPYHPLWNPFPGPQTQAMDSPASEIFFGGAAGGGKSDLALGLAITQHHKSLILRRVASYLKGLTDRIQQIAGSKRFRASGHGGILYLPNRGTVELNGCEHEKDKENFQGIPHDLLIFDELSHFNRSQYEFIIAWNRLPSSADRNQRCRVLCTGNPPTTPEGQWVIEAWAPWLDKNYPDPALPGELRWYTTINKKTIWKKSGEPFLHEGELITPISRTFIPALLRDNPILDASDYRSKLQSLPEPYRSMLLYGDMYAGQADHEWQLIPTEWVEAAMRRWNPDAIHIYPLECLGVDVARGGKDKMVIAPRYGPVIGELKRYDGNKTPDGATVAHRVKAMRTLGSTRVNIDILNVGSSPYDILADDLGKDMVSGINNANATDWVDRHKMFRFKNVRAASYWSLRESLDPEGDQLIALPPDNELKADLCAPRYRPTPSGIQIESKDDIIERLGRSPDAGDAVVLCHWLGSKKKQLWIR